MTIVEKDSKDLQRSDVTEATGNGFESFAGDVRSLDINPFTTGDEFTITGKEKVLNLNLNGNTAPFINVEVTNGDSKEIKRLFPSMYQKSAVEYDKNLNRVGRRRAKGTAVDLFQSFSKVSEAMSALIGKKQKITSVEEFTTTRFNAKAEDAQKLRLTQICNIELV